MNRDFIISNCDTDSLSFCKSDMSPFTEEEQEFFLNELNSLYPERIKWEHDGIFQRFIVLKTKNYLKLHDNEIETKGSSVRNPNKELALREFIDKVIKCLIYNKEDEIINFYYEYVREIFNVRDISRWVVKKTITESVLNPERTNEQKVLDALQGRQIQMGEKIYVYFDLNKKLKLQENWKNDHDPEALLKKLYNTILIFKNVYNAENIPKFHLKNFEVKCKLSDVLGIPHPEKVSRKKKTKEPSISLSMDIDDPNEGCN